jgi:predicted enzyme related to lactoylglutathione lyase
MKSFKKYVALLEGTNEDAKLIHAAVSKHLSDPNNFKQVLSTHHVKDGASHYKIPIHALDIPQEVKSRYQGFQGIKLSNAKAKGSGTYAHFQSRGKPSSGFLGKIKSFIGTGPSSHIAMNNMAHLAGSHAADPKMHGFLQKHTVDAWNKSFPVFRHEFEHLAQHASGKHAGAQAQKVGQSAYHNDPGEVGAHAAQFRVHLDQAFKDHPEEFKGIALNSPNRHKHIVNAMDRIATKNIDHVMKTAVNHYKSLIPENRSAIHNEIDGHMAENFKAWHDNRQAHVDSVKAKIAARRISNKGADIFGRSYPVYGEKKYSKVPSDKHTPEGVMYEPHEAVHQVHIYHNLIKDPVKRSAFYAANKIKHPFEGLRKEGKLDDLSSHSTAKSTFAENNPHVVADYLNTMARHFPKTAKRHGKLNYDENEHAHHDEMSMADSAMERLAAIKAKKK